MKPDGLRYHLDPFGCVKNQVDAENMMARLNAAGWQEAPEAEDADLVIVNSCGFIEDAKQESVDAVLLWRNLFPGKKILLSGCLAQRYAEELRESLTEADGFFGTDDISKITEAVAGLGLKTDLDPATAEFGRTFGEEPGTGSRPLLSLPGSAYVKISEGCNHTCSFCAIPHIRGAMRCRAMADILDECRQLLARGIRELCIVGQDICAYKDGDQRLPELLQAIGRLEGDFWVRLLYLHPDTFPLKLLDVMENDRRILPYFDLPFQHASKGILTAMERQGSAEAYLGLAQTIRGRLPAAVLRTTLLVGFPGETDADFTELQAFQEKLRPDWLGCFAYSREEGTVAGGMGRQVPKK
ncbi:MAG: MiaB/RimO family radical SAM methylthiotransferase, partial [Treponema sp.]|nr:MiaB/RimO family radical SAM methylthiotransferase [Treponema sp.]